MAAVRSICPLAASGSDSNREIHKERQGRKPRRILSYVVGQCSVSNGGMLSTSGLAVCALLYIVVRPQCLPNWANVRGRIHASENDGLHGYAAHARYHTGLPLTGTVVRFVLDMRLYFIEQGRSTSRTPSTFDSLERF